MTSLSPTDGGKQSRMDTKLFMSCSPASTPPTHPHTRLLIWPFSKLLVFCICLYVNTQSQFKLTCVHPLRLVFECPACAGWTDTLATVDTRPSDNGAVNFRSAKYLMSG